MSIVIQTHDLSRIYKTYRRQEGGWNAIKGFFNRQTEYKTALKPTTLTIEKGQIVGLVGANGAGKTTLLKILSGLIYPSSGESLGSGGTSRLSASRNFSVRFRFCSVRRAQLWWDLLAADSFNLLSSIYSLDSAQAKSDWLNLAERFALYRSIARAAAPRLSLGERMKMEIIGSLLHRPKILFLDEPTIGLDVLAQNTIRAFLGEYVREHQPTIILTSHYMDDISGAG